MTNPNNVRKVNEALVPTQSGLAAALSQGSEVADNLSNLMRNSIVIFESRLTLVSGPSSPVLDQNDEFTD